ncbi:MAG: hypothetical protein ACYTEK_11310, partial [Planctomycetota bacterium]
PCLMAAVENGVTRAVDVAKHVHFSPSALLCIADRRESKGWSGASGTFRIAPKSGLLSRSRAEPCCLRLRFLWSQRSGGRSVSCGKGTRGTGSLDGATGGPDGVARSVARPHWGRSNW